MSEYWFFLSYARLDQDKYLQRFYKDINAEVRLLSGATTVNVGFFDALEIEPGEEWSRDLEEALQKSAVFVSLYSATYFGSEYCGREWTIFLKRKAAYEAGLGSGQAPPPLMQPVLWVPKDFLPTQLPRAVPEIQYTYGRYPPNYAKEGLKQLIRVSKFRNDYPIFVRELASLIVTLGRQHKPPPLAVMPSIKEVQSAFHAPNEPRWSQTTNPDDRGPRAVEFIFVTGSREEMETADLRPHLDLYGAKRGDWKPYFPNVSADIESIAGRIASAENLRFEITPTDGDLIDQLKTAQQKNKIAVIILDTWTLQFPMYRDLMKEYDKNDFHNCVLLIPWNSQHADTLRSRAEREDWVKNVFSNKSARKDPSGAFLDNINSSEELEMELRKALTKILTRIAERGGDAKRAEGPSVVPRPTLIGVTA